MGFGRYVGLEAFYHQETDLKLFKATEGNETPQLFDLAQSGVQVSLALGSGTIVPVLVGGGSLLDFKPQEGERLKKLSLDYGGGLRIVLGESLFGQVLVESTEFRLDPGFLFTGEPSIEGTGPLRRNMTLQASLGLQVGRRSFDKASELDNAFAQRYQAPFSNFALAVEPLIGRLDYDNAIDLDNQEMVGARAGVDFGSFFGLRGFYWWGTESDFGATTDFRAWGGEAQFTLASGPGLNPYLVGGAGELSWGKAKDDEPARPEDQTALIVGGGVDFNFGSHIRATVAARDFILAGSDLAASPELNTISNPDDLVHNWQFSAGLKFLIARSGIRRGGPPREQVAEAPAREAGRAAEPKVPAQPAAAPPAGIAAPQPVPTPPTTPPAVAGGAEVLPVAPGQPGAQVIRDSTVVVLPDSLGKWVVPGQTIILPVLERGEIYIRFGEPGSVPLVTALRRQGEAAPAGAAPAGVPPVQETGPTLDDLRKLIQEELGKQTQRQQQVMDRAALEELESRLMRRLDEIERTARRAEAAAETPAPVVVRQRPGTPDTVVVTRPRDTSESISRRVEELRPYSGFNVTNDVQVLMGIGFDIGPLKAGSQFSLVPQAALGFGQGPSSFLVAADVEYRLPEVGAGSRVTFEPLVSLGPGLIKRDKMELQLEMFLGTGAQIFKRNGAPGLHLFGGIQGIDFFDDTRLIIGLRRSR